MTPGPRGKTFGPVAWAAAALFSAWVAFFLQEEWTRFPRGLLTDDAYFYVKIAWNLGVHGMSSFDGLHVTDGYHLLWAWVLAGVSAVVEVFSPQPAAHIGAMLWLYLMLCWTIALRFGRSFLGAFLLFSMGLVFKALMETTLLALLLLLLWEREYLASPGAPRWRWRPLLLLVIPLVRVDAALIAGVMALSSLFGGADSRPPPRFPAVLPARLRATVADLGWIAAGVALQLGTHFALFREWGTVSMLLKGAAGNPWTLQLRENLTGFYAANLLSVVVFVLTWGLATWAAWQRPREERFRHIVVLLAPALFVLFHLAANSTISYWYFVPAVIPHTAYLLYWGPPLRSTGLRESPRGSYSFLGLVGRGALVMVVLLFAAKWVVDTRVRGPQILESRRFIEEVRRLVPPGTPVYQIDASGWVGWFSGLPVVNGDGLVNDHTYVRRLREGRLHGYLRERGIRHIIQNVYPQDGVLLSQGGLVVPMDSVETIIAPPPDFPRLTAFGLYRLKENSSSGLAQDALP